MADVVHVKAPDLTRAAAAVAEQIETVAKPATAVAPHSAPASPVDVAASSAAQAIHTRMATMSGEMAPRGPAIQQAGTAAAAALVAQDAANAVRLPSVPTPPVPSAPALPQTSKPNVQALDSHWKQGPPEPPPPPPKPPVEGLPPEGLRPPVEGPLTEGPASRPSRAAKGGRSLYDQHGGEWRYYPGNERKRQYPHWDYKPRPGRGSDWDNIPIGDLPTHMPPLPSIINGLPPWLANPGLPAPPGAVGPPQNPLLTPFPGATMPPMPVPSAPPPGPGLFPDLHLPDIHLPDIHLPDVSPPDIQLPPLTTPGGLLIGGLLIGAAILLLPVGA